MNNFPTNRTPVFATERLQLAIYLHASGTLSFSHCSRATNGKVQIVFEDPNETGPQCELEFDRGAPVAASSLFASQKFLRRKMSEALDNRRNGETYGSIRARQ